MKHGFLIYLLFAFCLATNGQETRNILTGDYTELTDTKPVDKEAWDKQPGKPQLSWGSTDVRYSKLNVPSVNKTQRLRISGWKGERVNAQAILWTTNNLEKVSLSVSDLTNG